MWSIRTQKVVTISTNWLTNKTANLTESFFFKEFLPVIRNSRIAQKEVKQARTRLIFIIVHLFRQWVLTEHHIVGTEVPINDDDPFVASEKRTSHQFSYVPLRESSAASSKCSEYYHATDISTLVPESALFAISNHNTARFRYFL